VELTRENDMEPRGQQKTVFKHPETPVETVNGTIDYQTWCEIELERFRRHGDKCSIFTENCKISICYNTYQLPRSLRCRKSTDPAHRTKMSGRSNSGKPKLTYDEVIDIRDKLDHGMTCSEIAAIYGRSESLISGIKLGNYWKDVG
jgi:hypothetical protein